MEKPLQGRFRFLETSKTLTNIKKLGALLLFVLFTTSVAASHYRYGTINYTILGKPHPDSCLIEVTVTQAWEICSGVCHFPVPPVIGSVSPATSTLVLETEGGATVSAEPVFITVTSIDFVDDWYFGEYKTTMVVHSDSAYLLSYESTARIFGLVNNSSGAFRSETVVTPCGTGNESPKGTIAPIVKLPKTVAPVMFPVAAIDPNGDPLTFRLAFPTEATGSPGGGINAPGFVVTPTGTGIFPTAAATVGDLFNAWVAIEDTAGSKIILDFLIEVVDSSAPPMFDFAVTPPPAPCLEYHPGDLVKFTVKAFDPEPGDIVKISAVGVPIGAMIAPSSPTPGGNPDSLVFTWMVTPADIGSYVVSFSAVDTSSVSTSTSVCIKVLADTIADTTCVLLDSLTCVTDTSWRKSTVSTPSTVLGTWTGVGGALPPDGSFTLPVAIGQPYGYHSIDEVEDADVIKSGNNITYFRKTFTLSGSEEVAARLRLTVDDQAEIYVNGILLAGQYKGLKPNRVNPPFDAVIMADGTVINPNGANDPYDSITSMDLDDIFVPGVNTLTVALRNFSLTNDLGGFSFRMDLDYEYFTAACDVQDSCVSDSSWLLSTVTTVATSNMYPWPGVGTTPAEATFTLPVVIGQPYPWTHMFVVDGALPISATGGVTYYMKKFELTDHIDVDTRIRMFMDDDVEIFLNGYWLALEGSAGKQNWRTANHDILFKADATVDNGHMGGDAFDAALTAVDMDTVFTAGTNTLILALRNRTSKPDLGGFSFRMDVDKGGSSVLKKNGQPIQADTRELKSMVQVYPNPSSSWVNVLINADVPITGGKLRVTDLNGRVLQELKLDGHEMPVRLEAYPSGVYLISVETMEKRQTVKVFKY